MTSVPAVFFLVQYSGQNIALFSCGLFSGAAIYISLTECPPRTSLALVDLLALSRFVAGRTDAVLATLAIVTALTSIVSSFAGGGIGWLVGGIAHALMAAYIFTDVARVTTMLQSLDSGPDNEVIGKNLMQRRGLQFAVLSLGGLFAQYLFITNR